MGYGADAIYTRMSQRSLEWWKQVAPREFVRTGVLWIGREGHPYSTATVEVLRDASVPHEILTSAEIARRYPQMRFEEPGIFGIFEPESGALLARRAVARVCEGIPYEQHAIESPRGGQSWPQPPFRRLDPLESGSAGRIARPTISSTKRWPRAEYYVF